MNYCIHCMEYLGGDASVCAKCKMAQNYECPLHHLKPGTVLQEKYLVGKALGEGGFGITYIGRDLNLDMRIAIKEYYPNGFSVRNNEHSNTVTLTQPGNRDSFEKEMQRFLNEARTMAKFNDEPGIVDVRDFFRENGTAYIVMDFLDGITMKDYILQNGPIPAGKLFGMMEPVMKSLSCIHEKGLIHRDISPDNIMMLKNGKLKLLDFGAARDVTADKSLSVVLKHGYAPMEQYRTKGEQGSWTDVYALCATMYKCITGITPDESLERVYEDSLKAPSALGIAISPKQERVLLQGLRIRISDRVQDMETLRQGLMTADDQESTQSVHIQRTVEDDEVKTVYQPPVATEQKTPAASADETEKTVYQPKDTEKPKEDETEKTVYQPEKPEAKTPADTAAEQDASGKKKKGKKEKKPAGKDSAEMKPEETAKQEPGKKKKLLPLIIGGAVAVLAVVLVLTMVLGGPSEGVTAIAGNDSYSVTLVEQFEDDDRSVEITYQSLRDSVNESKAFQLLNSLGEPITDDTYVAVTHLGYGLYAATDGSGDPDGICPEVNRVSLLDSQGNVLIPNEACLIRRPYQRDNMDSRYLIVYYATEKTDNDDECVICVNEDGSVYTSKISGGTMYNGYIKVYDLEKKGFLENLPEIKDMYDVRTCGSSLVIGDYSDAVMYDSEGNVLLDGGGIMDVGDGTLITSSGGTYRVYDETGTQTYYANQYIGLVDNSQYITMEVNDKDLVMDRNGNTVLEAVYDQINAEHNGVFHVSNDGMDGLVTIDGKELVPCQYEWVSAVEGDYFGSTYFYCNSGGKYTLVGENGIIATGLNTAPSELVVEDEDSMLVLNNRSYDLELGESRYSRLAYAMIAVSSETNGLYGVYDLYTGTQLLPYEYETVAYAVGHLYAYKNGVWEVYEVTYSK